MPTEAEPSGMEFMRDLVTKNRAISKKATSATVAPKPEMKLLQQVIDISRT